MRRRAGGATARRPWVSVAGQLGAVRVRAACSAALIVGVVLAVSAFGTVALLRNLLYDNAANTARSEALDVASFVATRGAVPPRLPISDEEMAVQIVDRSDAVVASSANVAGQAPMVGLQPEPGHESSAMGVVLHVRHRTHVNLDLDSRFAVTAMAIRSGSLDGTVLVASSLGAADRAVRLVSIALALGVPLLMLLVGALVWWLMGRSLRPVELIRAEVAELSATDLSRRVPEPAAHDEIGRLARTMNAMLARLESSSARQRQLVADVSHELRNPLASLRTQLEVAVAHPGPPTVDLLDGAIAEVARTGRLLDDLLTLARLDEHSVPLRCRDVDLDEVVLFVAGQLRTRATTQISVHGVSAARIDGDEDQLRRLITNLAENAVRYARSQASFGLRLDGAWARLTVGDDGAGVPEAMREQIFERFVRIDDARTHQGTGAGLGLAIAREITTAHGGSIWVEDAKPGARFVVQLPVAHRP